MLNFITSAFVAVLCAILWFAPHEAQAQQFQGFAASKYYLVQGGQQPSLQQVARDMRASKPRIFRSAATRQAFLLDAYQRFGTAADSAGKVARLLRSDQVRLVPCKGNLISLGYNPTTGRIASFQRRCVAGEVIVQLRMGDRWVNWFSLGCLNPIAITVAPVAPSSACYATMTNGQQVQGRLLPHDGQEANAFRSYRDRNHGASKRFIIAYGLPYNCLVQTPDGYWILGGGGKRYGANRGRGFDRHRLANWN